MAILKYKNANGEWVALPNAEVKMDTREWRYFEAEKTNLDGTTPEYGQNKTVKYDFSSTGIDFENNDDWIMFFEHCTRAGDAKSYIISPLFAKFQRASQVGSYNGTKAPYKYQVWNGISNDATSHINDNPQFPNSSLRVMYNNAWHDTKEGVEHDALVSLYKDYLLFDETGSQANGPSKEISQKVKLYYLA